MLRSSSQESHLEAKVVIIKISVIDDLAVQALSMLHPHGHMSTSMAYTLATKHIRTGLDHGNEGFNVTTSSKMHSKSRKSKHSSPTMSACTCRRHEGHNALKQTHLHNDLEDVVSYQWRLLAVLGVDVIVHDFDPADHSRSTAHIGLNTHRTAIG